MDVFISIEANGLTVPASVEVDDAPYRRLRSVVVGSCAWEDSHFDLHAPDGDSTTMLECDDDIRIISQGDIISAKPNISVAAKNCLTRNGFHITQMDTQDLSLAVRRKAGNTIIDLLNSGLIDVNGLCFLPCDPRTRNHFGGMRVYTPLMVAVEGEVTSLIEILYAAGADVDEKTGRFPETALALAADMGVVEVVRTLLRLGASTKGSDGAYPLLLAVRKGHSDVAEALLSAGADPTVKRGSISPLSLAVSLGRTDMIKKH